VIDLIAASVLPVESYSEYVVIFARARIPVHAVHFYVIDLLATTVLPVELYIMFFAGPHRLRCLKFHSFENSTSCQVQFVAPFIGTFTPSSSSHQPLFAPIAGELSMVFV
jgi:hypothetical protein